MANSTKKKKRTFLTAESKKGKVYTRAKFPSQAHEVNKLEHFIRLSGPVPVYTPGWPGDRL